MRLRLKDLNKLTGETVDFYGILREVVGLKKYWFFKKIFFSIAAKKAISLVNEYRNMNIDELVYNEKSDIKKPSNIDNISYKAMMELVSEITSSNAESDPVEVMVNVIAIGCYSENVEQYYDSNGEKFDDFKNQICNSPLEDMVGLYNSICVEAHESQVRWKKMFMSVKVDNPDLERAGISRMSQFNVLNTLKSMCQEFNCSYDEAWQMSYALTQTNAYSKATYDHIHENLRIIKEQKMKTKRRRRYS